MLHDFAMTMIYSAEARSRTFSQADGQLFHFLAPCARYFRGTCKLLPRRVIHVSHAAESRWRLRRLD